MINILVTNDDGIESPGIKILADVMRQIGRVTVVAPEREQSAVAHALTLHRPLKSCIKGDREFAINGTPTDCVILAVNKLLKERPDIIVSGINNGGNIGDNVTYSGTVAAAIEGTLLGISSIAVSLVTNYESPDDGDITAGFRTAADFARDVVLKVQEAGLPEDTLLNINIPLDHNDGNVEFTRQGKLTYDNGIQELSDPRGMLCYWIGGGQPQWASDGRTDIEAVHNGMISITPIHLDLTNYRALEHLKQNWSFD